MSYVSAIARKYARFLRADFEEPEQFGSSFGARMVPLGVGSLAG